MPGVQVVVGVRQRTGGVVEEVRLAAYLPAVGVQGPKRLLVSTAEGERGAVLAERGHQHAGQLAFRVVGGGRQRAARLNRFGCRVASLAKVAGVVVAGVELPALALPELSGCLVLG